MTQLTWNKTKRVSIFPDDNIILSPNLAKTLAPKDQRLIPQNYPMVSNWLHLILCIIV